MTDLGFQVDVVVRLLVASLLGGAIGFEREVHGHPAGMRTHLLVCLGSALFTVLSIFGFPPAEGAPLDPSRVAAQIVSGIGFLGAGAIIKEGFSVRGLTTAASLWATAGIGMAAGAAQHVVALAGAAIILFSLWPLSRIAERVHGRRHELREVRLLVDDLAAVVEIAELLTQHDVEVVAVEKPSRTHEANRVAIGVRATSSSDLDAAVREIGALPGVTVIEVVGRSGD